MSYRNGWAAINMEFSDKVPRTEYSVGMHLPLLKAVTGIDAVTDEDKERAMNAIVKAWDFGMVWGTNVSRNWLEKKGGRTTRMGHAVYKADGSDFNTEIRLAFETPEDALTLDAVKEYGEFEQAELIAFFEDIYRQKRARFPDAVTPTGVYVTLFSGLIEIFGFDMLLLTAGLYEKEFGKVIEGYYQWVKQFFDAYAKTDIPLMMVHDDLCWTAGPPMRPEWYRKYAFPYIKKLIAPVKEAGKKILFTSDGKIDEFFDDFVDCGADMVIMEPISDIRAFAKKHGDRVGFVGGLDCRSLIGHPLDVLEREIVDILEFGKRYPGFMLAVGNHIPPDVPLERALFYNEVYEKHAYR